MKLMKRLAGILLAVCLVVPFTRLYVNAADGVIFFTDLDGIQVYIGDETPVKTMKDCSVVTATYELGEGMKGTIGIIGPKRMDYEHVMKTLKTLQSELDAIYYKDPEE